MPISPWPRDQKAKELGEAVKYSLEHDMEGMIQYTATVLADWSKEEVQVLFALLRRELRNPNIHAYFPQKVVWAQKPEV